MLIIVGCTAFGILKSCELQVREKELEDLKQVFIMLKDEMQYARASLGEIFWHTSVKAKGVYRTWLQKISEDLTNKKRGTFQEIWILSIQELEKGVHLKRNELEDLKCVGQHLSSIASLNMYLGQLDLSINMARNDVTSKKKIYQSMGFLGGIFLVIILI